MPYENLWPGSCKELSGISYPRVVSKPRRQSALLWSTSELRNKTGQRTTVREVITGHAVTVLFFGSPCYRRSQAMAEHLKDLQAKCQELARSLAVIYVPLYTYRENSVEVEDDFLENHGDRDWWMMGYQSWESLEAKYMHQVCVVPTLVVVDREGGIVTESGQADLYNIKHDVLITWF
uniref:Thioredoxin-like fold domain-containing protein n=1 Tax=Graphocephala atropunctata TaxID=36148 RepID=A0A1B6MJP4_9HEMI